MTHNVGPLDLAIRLVLGLALAALAATGHVGVWGYLGLVLAATGVFRFCPLYRILGITTCRRRG